MLFFLICITGIILRLHNLSPFKIYPDSFQNLVVAQNIATYHSVVGFLGPQGMLYPDFFMWTRTAYALLILLTNFVTNNMTIAAQFISLFAGILAIPLAYLLIKKIFYKTAYAIAGSLLIALSYNHTVWSGFIMTETVSVFFMLLFLWSFFSGLKTNNNTSSHPGKPTRAHPGSLAAANISDSGRRQNDDIFRDFLTGMLFAFAVMSRYEYFIVLLPVIYLTFQTNPKPFLRLSSMLSGLILTLLIVVVQLFPLDSVFSVIIDQQQDLAKLVGILIILFICLFVGKKIIKHVIPDLPARRIGGIGDPENTWIPACAGMT